MASWGQRKTLLVPLFLTSCTSALRRVIQLYLVLGAWEGENKKVTLSQSLKASRPPQDTLHQATAEPQQPRRPPGDEEKKLPAHQRAKEAPRILARASHGHSGAGKVCAPFPAAQTACLFGRLSSNWLWLQCMGKAASRPTVVCHGLWAQRSAPKAKGVSWLETQAAYEERQEESEQTALPEAQRVGTQ